MRPGMKKKELGLVRYTKRKPNKKFTEFEARWESRSGLKFSHIFKTKEPLTKGDALAILRFILVSPVTVEVDGIDGSKKYRGPRKNEEHNADVSQ